MRSKTEWLRLEAEIRQQLKLVSKSDDVASLMQSLFNISEIIGEQTGRGYELDSV